MSYPGFGASGGRNIDMSRSVDLSDAAGGRAQPLTYPKDGDGPCAEHSQGHEYRYALHLQVAGQPH